MISAAIGPDSDVELQTSSSGVRECVRCSILGSLLKHDRDQSIWHENGTFMARNSQDMLCHLSEHLKRGHLVPYECLDDLYRGVIRSSLNHAGRWYSRTHGSSVASLRESLFALGWMKQNHPDTSQTPLLEALLSKEEPGRFSYTPIRRLVVDFLTQRDAMVAATVIQWLGSNVGWAWLNEIVEACGYRLVPKDK